MLDVSPTIADDAYMAHRKVPLSEQLRRAVKDSGHTRYAIWKATGVSQATLSKFLSGERGLSFEAMDKLAAFLNLEITKSKSSKSKGS
jgi:transcriptional regulator with XRE-family HTH domain